MIERVPHMTVSMTYFWNKRLYHGLDPHVWVILPGD